MFLTLEDIEGARRRIDDRVHHTPIFTATTLGEMADLNLSLKAELFQKTGSFKPRGVFNKLLSMDDAERSRGLVSLSAGNHAAALAYAARALRTNATIVMPATVVPAKIEATRGYGGEVVLTEERLLEVCLEIQRERNLVLVHPFDDLSVMAGQGTVGLEILEDVPDADAVIVPIGGGGLISGIATAVKLQRPSVELIGVEPEGADAMSQSLEQGRPVHLDHVETVADGLAAPFAGEHTFPHVQRLVDGIVRVSDQDIVKALRLLIGRCKLAAEPSGAAALAALLTGRTGLRAGSRVVCVVSGGNVAMDRLRSLLSDD